jgi:hypothetical protein
MKHMKKWMLLLSTVASLALVAPASSVRADDDTYEDEEEEAESDADEATDEEIEDTDPSAVVIYRDRLAPHGTWVDHPDYGTVWVPSADAVGPDFAPYVSNGRWELTADGDWLWVSGYDWGYIPFHDGRWLWVGDLGWSWIPGRRYAPAWVDWRVGANGFIGWAPMGPSFFWVGSSWFWFNDPFPSAFVFCPTAHVFHHHVHTHVVRDRADIQRAAAGTSRHGAQPTLNRNRTPASPTLDQAGVPKSAAPKGVGKHDQRALDLAGKKSQAMKGKVGAAAGGGDARKPQPSSEGRSSFAAPRARQEAEKQRSRRQTEEAAFRSNGPSSSRGDTLSSTRTPATRGATKPGATKPSATRSMGTSDGAFDSQPSRDSDRGASTRSTPRTREAVSTPPRSKETTSRTRQSRGGSFESRSRPSSSSAPSRSSAPKASPGRSSSPKSSSVRSSGGGSRSSAAPRSSGSSRSFSSGSRSSGGSRSTGGGSRGGGGGRRGR